ncbi:MAG: peptide deformylase [Anaerolineae bacterium]|nr:peptide deformylase [Anaerolineae bacterium]
MAIREIVSTPHPVLRKKAHKVTKFDRDLQVLIDDMIETMREAPGVGLAANQVGVAEQVIVVEYGEEEDDQEGSKQAAKKLYVVVNPQIVESSPETVMGVEACLSVPNYYGEVERHTQVVVKGLNRRGKPLRVKAEGWLARIFQHEIDHLEGILFTDRATRIWQPKEDESLPADV